MTRRLHHPIKRVDRRIRPWALEPCDRSLRRAKAGREGGLGEAGVDAGLANKSRWRRH